MDNLKVQGRPKKLLKGRTHNFYLEDADLDKISALAEARGLTINEVIRRLIKVSEISQADSLERTTAELETLKREHTKLQTESAEKLKLFDTLAAENKTLKEDLATKSKEMDQLVTLKKHQDDKISRLKKRTEMWWTNIKPLNEQTGGETG